MRFVLLVLGFLLPALAASAQENEDVIVVFDVSNSMWGQIDGVAKIEIARDVMGGLLQDWDPATNLGLVAYGHRTTDDCSDIETVIPPGPLDADAYMARIAEFTPRGRTPLTAAVEHAAEELAYRDSRGTVILISDGVESCERDPCALANLLAEEGIGFTAHVIGFGLGADEDTETLACIAEATGGLFLTAQNADELTGALAEVRETVAQAQPVAEPEPAPEPEPTPEPEPEPLPEMSVELGVPPSAIIGAVFPVTWDPIGDDRDYITIVPLGADEGTIESYVRANAEQPAGLQAPADAGLYEVRYVRNEDRATLGVAEIEIVEAEMSVMAPATATAGSVFDVTWSNTIDDRDYITIVPLGADEGTIESYIRANATQPADLQAPAEPGLYEVRYVLNEGRRTLAIAEIEIVEAEASVTAPATATAGSVFDVSWSNVIDDRDYITIVPLGADEGTIESYVRANAAQPADLQAPAEPGLYEVRYVLNEGRRTLATAEIEIVEAEASVTAPATATAGAVFRVTWSDAIDDRDYITIVPFGADEGTIDAYVRANANQPADLQAPGEPGLYEVRYVLNEGRRTLATADIEIVEAEVTLQATEIVRATDDIEITWSNTINERDYVTIVPVGTEDATIGEYVRANATQPARLEAPEETGLYEIRYVLNEGGRTLAAVTVEVVAADATLDQGAALDVPATVSPGATFEVSWTLGVEAGNQRIALARVDQADFTWIAAVAAAEGPPAIFEAPAEPGFYEIRFLDIGARAVLGRATIEVR